MKHTTALAAALAIALMPGLGHSRRMPPPAAQPASYEQVARSVANMLGNYEVTQMIAAKGLNLVNVMWEDTGRYLGSSVGPNISDVTIEVEVKGDHGQRNYLMPVMRYPNFTDKTADIALDKFFIRVGNHAKNAPLKTISLRELLAHPGRYMSLPNKGTIVGNSLLAPRDRHALVSAQAAFLPVPQRGQATFYPVIFNYQSYAGNPAVLTILATRQGTSITVVDNSRDTVTGGASWGQRLFVNTAGERAPLIAERLTDVMASGTTANGESAASLGKDANLLLLIQVPLKVKAPPAMAFGDYDGAMAAEPAKAAGPASGTRTRSSARGSDLDVAVLGHGKAEGPYTELDGLTIERDPRFPVRVTVQLYQATSTGTIDQEHVDALAKQIDAIYERGDYVGSLVVPDGELPRPTAWTNASPAPQTLDMNAFPGLIERVGRFGAYPWQLVSGWWNR